MCGRYFISARDDEEIAALIAEMNRRAPEKNVKTGEIFPGDEALTVAVSRAGNARPFLMRWGMETAGRLLINARSETAGQKPMFRALLKERRMLIPASGYFEWEKAGKRRVKYELTAGDGAVFMAGVYRLAGERAEFAILTRQAAPTIAFIHSRMPVILGREAAEAWLRADCDPERLMGAALEDVRFRTAEKSLLDEC